MAYTWHISTRFKWHFRWVPMADGDPIVKALQRLVQEMEGSRCVSVEFSHVFTSKMAISTKYQWEFQDPIHGGTLVPYFWPYELWGYSPTYHFQSFFSYNLPCFTHEKKNSPGLWSETTSAPPRWLPRAFLGVSGWGGQYEEYRNIPIWTPGWWWLVSMNGLWLSIQLGME